MLPSARFRALDTPARSFSTIILTPVPLPPPPAAPRPPRQDESPKPNVRSTDDDSLDLLCPGVVRAVLLLADGRLLPEIAGGVENAGVGILIARLPHPLLLWYGVKAKHVDERDAAASAADGDADDEPDAAKAISAVFSPIAAELSKSEKKFVEKRKRKQRRPHTALTRP